MVKHELGEYNSPLSADYAALRLESEIDENSYYLVEKMGLEVLQMTGYREEGGERNIPLSNNP
jgi:hypothetical protein